MTINPQSIYDSISIVESTISHWDPHNSISPSFLEASDRLHSHLLRLSAAASRNHAAQIIVIHTLLQSAMELLEESFKHHVFSISAIDLCSDKIATARSIAKTMLSAGYGKECVSSYQSIRLSRLTSQMVQLGFDQSANQLKAIRKLKWDILDRQIKSWTDIAPVVIQSLCSDEQQLCDEIFATSPESVRDSIFSSIACDTALRFLSFPETVSVHLKPSPEKLFRLLNMYAVLSNLLTDIESIFGSEPESSVRSKATSSLGKLSQAIRVVISKFELAIQKDPLKSSGVPGGAIHPLTRYVMNYLAYLSDFKLYLDEILVELPKNYSSSFFKLSDRLKNGSVVSVTIEQILFILLCKIDAKAEAYSDATLSYLFLANNLQYIIRKVQSCPLKEILNDEWMNEHSTKACQFMEAHVRSGWAHMAAMLRTENETDDVDRLREFEIAFEKAMKGRKDWVVADAAMRDEVRVMVETMLVPEYSRRYRTHMDFGSVRFSPEDVKKSIMKFYADISTLNSSLNFKISLSFALRAIRERKAFTTMSLRDLLSQPSSFSSHSNPSPQSISDSISTIQSAISHWDPHTSISTSFLQASNHLHSHLLHLSTSSSATAASINHADQRNIHTLLQSAMECLGESLRYHLFSISAIDLCSDKIATARSISQTMLSAGYGNECVSAYQSIRRSRVTSQMVQLRFDQSANQPKAIRKLKWEILDRQIKSWTDIAPVVVQSICSDEKQLCDEIFAMSPESVRNSIFSSIACDTALRFLSFPETVAVHLEHSPEKLFRLLDMYAVLSNLLPDIELIFGFEPDSSVRSQATLSLAKLSEAIRVVISNFELAIQKDPIKSSGVPGGAIHPLTRYVMNYLVYLSDFDLYLHEILVKLPPNCSSSFFEISDKLKNNGSVVSVTIAWILFILLCKIDSKAEAYSNAALSYLFLANNLRYITIKVQSSRLKGILSDEWMNEHSTKAHQFIEGHVRSGWAHMAAMLCTKNGTEEVERVQEFEMAFEKAMEERKNWAIADVAMRDEVRLMVEAMLVPEYCRWYRTHKDFGTVRFSPEDVKTSIMRFYAD
ncbi:uncharacterized protein LOC144575195 [Carex rostrata]